MLLTVGCRIFMFWSPPNSVLPPSVSDLMATFQPQQGRQKDETMQGRFQEQVSVLDKRRDENIHLAHSERLIEYSGASAA